MPKKIGNNVLILGGGRWGQVTYNNLQKLKNISNLDLVSKSLTIKNNILINKNIKIFKYFFFEKYKNYNLIIICKNNISKIFFLNKLLNFKNNIVVEKPLIIKKKINLYLTNIKRKKIYISLPWYFDNRLKKIYSKIINNKKFNRIQFKWFDSIEKKYGIYKKFDDNIKYSEDIFAHVFSILNYNLMDLNSLKFIDFKIKNNIEHLRFNYNNIEIELICSNKLKKISRDIFFFNNNQKNYGISILDNLFKIKDYNKNLSQTYKRDLNQLNLQYIYILKNKKINNFKKVCYFQVLYQYELNQFLKKIC